MGPAADSHLVRPSGAPAAAARTRLVAVIQDDCTGCNTCVDYCLVDCIEPLPPAQNPQSPASVHIREDECIGCAICATVCEELALNAIHLVPVEGTGSGPATGSAR
jgi:Pyruvate/2-oxoacid:ferredoxin oxidoreductase delta subunit